MKKILTLSTIAALSLGLTPTAMANWDFLNRSEFHVAGVLSKPSNNGLETGSLGMAPIPTAVVRFSPAVNLLDLEPSAAWNYALGYSYTLCGTTNKFFMDYEHFHAHDGLAGQVNDGLLLDASLVARVDMSQDMFRFGFSHQEAYDCNVWLETSVFFEFDRLLQKYSNLLYNPSALYSTTGGGVERTLVNGVPVLLDNKLNGFGPGVGFKLSGAPIVNCPQFKLFGGIMASLLYARQYGYYYRDLAIAEVNPAPPPPAIINVTPLIIDPDTNVALVTKLDIDVGIDYRQKFCVDNAKMMFGLTVGLRYVNMINALKYSNRINFSNVQPLSNYDPVDWGRAGPYIQFRLGGADA